MSKLSKQVYLSTLFLTGLFVFSYYTFTTYKPKSLRQIAEVKSAATSDLSSLPYPKDSEKIGTDRTSSSEITTIRTSTSPQEVQDFYKTIFVSRGWEIESIGDFEDHKIYKYKNPDNTVTIQTFEEQDTTIVSIEMAER